MYKEDGKDKCAIIKRDLVFATKYDKKLDKRLR